MKTNAAKYQFRASSESDTLLLEVYGPIGASIFQEGITAQSVADALKGPETRVTVRINSPGGNAFEGLTIFNLLKTSGKTVDVIIDGLAASAASIIAMAGDSIQMNEGTMFMVHSAQGMVAGDAPELRKMADVLDKVSGNMANVYATRTKQTVESVMEMMTNETWLSPGDALKFGFADKIAEDPSGAIALAAEYNLSAIYAKTPEFLKVYTQVSEKVGEVKPADTNKNLIHRLSLL